jgi:phospholipase/carboxylesterase
MRPRRVTLLRIALAISVTAVAASCNRVHDITESLPLVGSHADGRLDARPVSPTVEPPEPGRHDFEIEGHRVLLYVPRSAVSAERASPFALLLHGASGSAEGGFRMWVPYAEKAGMILLAPQSQHGGAWDVMVGGFGSDVAMIDAELAWVFQRFRIDERHLAIAGFSNGATYSLSLGVTNGDLFTHIVAMSPGFMVPGEPHGQPPVFVSHGLRARVLPIDQASREIVPQLRRAGYRVTFVTFDGGHHLEPSIARRALRWFLGRR